VSLTERKRQFKTIGFLFLLAASLIFPLIYNNHNISYEENRETDFIKTSLQRTVTTEWLTNNEFLTQDAWVWENGTEGDNSDMNAIISSGQANYEVLGETRTYSGISGVVNSSTSPGWGIFNNSGYLPPHTAEINAEGCYVAHHWDETAGGDSQIYNYPSIRFKKNVSLDVDFSDYVIKSASLEVYFNASVDANIDTPNDNYTGEWDEDLYAIGDFATFYVLISDLDNDHSYPIAYNRTKYLGQYGFTPSLTPILSIPDSPMYVYSQDDIITALNSALDKDLDHSNFTITLGIDIYSEDNDRSGDHDDWDSLMIKTCNFTFTYEKIIDQSTSVSWNQVGNSLNSSSIQVTDARFFFKYKVNNTWPSSAPLSEIKFYLNNKSHNEGIIKLTNFTTSWQDAKLEGFDVTSLISMDVNITVSIEVFLKDTLELGHGISINIDDVYLNITYIETFPDYGTNLELFIDDENKTLDPFLEIPIGELINITAKFTNASTGEHIIGANVLLKGERVLENLTEINEQYTIEINSTRDLNMRNNFLTVKAQFLDHETMILNPRIYVRKIKTEIVPISESNLVIQPGESVDIDVIINNTDYDNYVIGAIVTYSWKLGQGEFTDDNSDGIYNASINNIPAGVYLITITAFSGDDYSYETYQIMLTVKIPIDPIWNILLYVLIGGIIGIVSIFTLYQTRLKYPPVVRKVRKLRKKIRKGKKLKQITIENRGDIIERNIKENQKILKTDIEINSEKKKGETIVLDTEPKKTTINEGGFQ